MALKTFAAAAAALSVPLLLATPSEARTAFQEWAQGQGVYVSSKDHPPGGIQGFLVGGSPYGYPPPPGYGYRYAPPPPPPYGYGGGYGYGDPDY